VGLRRQFDLDRIPGSNLSGSEDDAHDAGFEDWVSLLVAAQNRRHQTRPVGVQLPARIPEASHAYDCGITNVKPRSPWQREQVNTARRDILSNCPGSELETTDIQLVKQFLVDQVYLTEIWSGWVFSNARAVLDGYSKVSIALDSQPN
jgi:hypothetical protein